MRETRRGGDERTGVGAAVVVAAGAGVRFGDGPAKQFLELEGRPVLAWACEALRAHPGIARLVVVLPAEVARRPPGWVSELADRVVAGGATRRESVGRGVEVVGGEADRILVHDGVRPFPGAGLVDRIWEAAAGGAVVPGLPIPDTVKEVSGRRVERTLRRERLVRVQTPQGFPADLLRRVHREAEEAGEDAPDDAALCEARGVPVSVVEGEPLNVKITTAADLAYAAWLVREGRVGARACDTSR